MHIIVVFSLSLLESFTSALNTPTSYLCYCSITTGRYEWNCQLTESTYFFFVVFGCTRENKSNRFVTDNNNNTYLFMLFPKVNTFVKIKCLLLAKSDYIHSDHFDNDSIIVLMMIIHWEVHVRIRLDIFIVVEHTLLLL